jgi:hypothetical protein
MAFTERVSPLLRERLGEADGADLAELLLRRAAEPEGATEASDGDEQLAFSAVSR